ncbi:MAG: universal stress protein [Nitrosomonas sp.]|nr:universal stress protein [Nitrosomonas sp.]MDP1950373.1 universal stress protein [Nitrosomonas sp.]
MSAYQSILLAVDFSTQDDYVAKRAKYLAETFNAELRIIHVLDNIPMPDTPYGTVIALDGNSSYSLLETEKNKLRKIADQLEIDPMRRRLVWGEPKQEIIQLAAQEKVDLIIVGSHGRHGLAMLLGSTANDVLYYAKCDVLAVRLQEN